MRCWLLPKSLPPLQQGQPLRSECLAVRTRRLRPGDDRLPQGCRAPWPPRADSQRPWPGGVAPIVAGVPRARHPARAGVDRSSAGDRGSCGPLALALGKQRPAVRRAELRETDPAVVNGFDEILHSELKTSIICRALVQRFPGQTILSATGIRRQESPNRAKAPVAKPQPKLASASWRTQGLDWHPILDWTTQQVFGYLEEKEFPLHEAYTRYGSSRVSCCFCILSSQNDLAAAARCAENQAVYRDLVALEAASTFPFQPTRWLGDVAPHWLTEELRQAVVVAKAGAQRREAAEAKIPQHLLYTEGWPRTIPTRTEASLLGEIRREVADAVGIQVGYREPLEVIQRYEELLSSRVATAA